MRGYDGDYEQLYKRYLALTRQVDHLSTLREVALAVSGSLELNETLPLVVTVVQGALDVRRVTIYELRAQEAVLVPVVARYGRDLIGRERLEEESVPRQRDPFADAMDHHNVVILNRGQQSSAYVPLLVKDQPLGVMLLEDPHDGVPFSSEDASFYRQVGSQIALAINNAQLYAMAVTDGLTKLFVRRYFDLRMVEEFAAAQRYHRAFSLLLFDIDHFKKFNDTHGHQTGDRVLQQVAELLQTQTREADICCRYGGEEMTVILPETELNEATLLANKLCAAIREAVFRGTENQALSVTVSIGVAAYDEAYESVEALVEAADEALYRAKELGRNRVEIAVNGA